MIREVDVLVDGERIEKIAAGIDAEHDVEVIDAGGRYLIPGMIDDQVHFREPGLTSKGNLATESAAAAAGGNNQFYGYAERKSSHNDGRCTYRKVCSGQRTLLSKLRVLHGRDQQQLRRHKSTASERCLRYQGVYGRVDGRYADR